MIIPLKSCPVFIAGDQSELHEMLHPDKAALELRYSLAHAKVAAGQSTTPHSLKTSEVYFIIQGEGLMHIDEKTYKVVENDTVYIPPEAKQYIKNIGKDDLLFICIVDPAWKKEDETVYPTED